MARWTRTHRLVEVDAWKLLPAAWTRDGNVLVYLKPLYNNNRKFCGQLNAPQARPWVHSLHSISSLACQLTRAM